MKVKQLLYGMMYGLLIFFTVSCSEENSENLPDNVAIYQVVPSPATRHTVHLPTSSTAMQPLTFRKLKALD